MVGKRTPSEASPTETCSFDYGFANNEFADVELRRHKMLGLVPQSFGCQPYLTFSN